MNIARALASVRLTIEELDLYVTGLLIYHDPISIRSVATRHETSPGTLNLSKCAVSVRSSSACLMGTAFLHPDLSFSRVCWGCF